MLRSLIYKYFPFEHFDSDEEFSLFLTFGIINTLVWLVHVFLLIFYIINKYDNLVFLNIISIVLYLIVFLLILRKKFKAAGYLTTFEITLYAGISTIILGVDSLVILYYLVVLILQFVLPYTKVRKRLIMSLAIWVIMIATYVVTLYYDIPNKTGHIKYMGFFNLNVTFFGVMLGLVVGQFVQSMLEQVRYNRIKELENKANRDLLTGLYNRHAAEQFFLSAKNKKYYVAMADIDNFKAINDTYGHDVGDQVLAELAKLMTENLRSTDVIFRWGGEEFLVMIEHSNKNAVFLILDKVRKLVENRKFSTSNLDVTITIGATQFDFKNIKDNIIQCDKLLYSGKKTKNCVVI